MVTNNYVLNLNIDQSDVQETDIKMVQNDYNVNVFEIHIFDGDDEINYSDVDSGIIIFKQTYKDIVKQGNLVKAVDKFTYTLESINFDGDCLCSVQLYGANDERITTTYFKVKIIRDLITDKSVKTDSEYDALKKLKNELEEIDVVDLQNDLNTHKAENVSQSPHGITAIANKNYDRGTWTPIIADGAGFTTDYVTQYGRFQRVDDVFYINGYIKASVTHTGQIGALRVSGLPAIPRAGSFDALSGFVSRFTAEEYTQVVARHDSTRYLLDVEFSLIGSGKTVKHLAVGELPSGEVIEIYLEGSFRV